ncbi:hypothetical protein D3C87_1167990 [compost metagenome]
MVQLGLVGVLPSRMLNPECSGMRLLFQRVMLALQRQNILTGMPMQPQLVGPGVCRQLDVSLVGLEIGLPQPRLAAGQGDRLQAFDERRNRVVKNRRQCRHRRQVLQDIGDVGPARFLVTLAQLAHTLYRLEQQLVRGDQQQGRAYRRHNERGNTDDRQADIQVIGEPTFAREVILGGGGDGKDLRVLSHMPTFLTKHLSPDASHADPLKVQRQLGLQIDVLLRVSSPVPILYGTDQS